MDEDERRLFRLTETHRKLEEQIREEQRRPLPDSTLILQMKREKLFVKEQLQNLRSPA